MLTVAELEADLTSIQTAITALESDGVQSRGGFGRQYQRLGAAELYAERRRLREEIKRHPDNRAARSFTIARPVR